MLDSGESKQCRICCCRRSADVRVVQRAAVVRHSILNDRREKWTHTENFRSTIMAVMGSAMHALKLGANTYLPMYPTPQKPPSPATPSPQQVEPIPVPPQHRPTLHYPSQKRSLPYRASEHPQRPQPHEWVGRLRFEASCVSSFSSSGCHRKERLRAGASWEVLTREGRYGCCRSFCTSVCGESVYFIRKELRRISRCYSSLS